MELNFTDSGRAHTEGKENEWREIFERMTWHEFKEGENVAMMPGMAINQIIEEMQPRK